MADYLVLKKTPDQTGPTSWAVVNFLTGKTADNAGATEALKESYSGPGRYGVVRADNARTTNITVDPKVTDDSSPTWGQ